MNKKVLAMLAILLIPTVLAIAYFGQVQRDVTITKGIVFTGIDAVDIILNGERTVYSEDLNINSVTSVNAPIDIITTHTLNNEGCTIKDTENFLLDNSAGTCANYPAEGWREECEKRIGIDVDMPLSDLETISWSADVVKGYAPHVDVILDNGKSLTFEYATIDLDCNAPASYPTGEIETFDDMGIVDNDAYAWESLPGPCGDGAFEAQHNTLTEWKAT